MKILKQFKKLSFVLLLLLFTTSSVFAQDDWYVNSTNGNDVAFDGTTSSTPFKTIEKAIASAAADDKVYVAAGTYVEATVDMDVDLTFEVTVFQNSQTAILNNGLIIDADVIFDVAGGDFQVAAATLTDGSLSLATAGLTITDGGLLTVVDGTIAALPTYSGDINITYTSTAAYDSGPEVPADLGDATLTMGSAFDITIQTAFDATDIVVNGAGGDLYLEGDVTLGNGADINNSATIDLGGKTLTYAPDGAANTVTAFGTIENGTLVLDGEETITHTAVAVLPDVEIPSSRTSTFTTANNITVDSFTLASGTSDAFIFGGAHTLTVEGNFNRSSNAVGNFDALTNDGILTFAGDGNSVFDPGANLTIEDLVLNKGVATSVVTMNASVEVENDVTLTAGELELGDFNITLTGAAGDFDNSGSFYSTSGNGYIVFENADVGGVGVAGTAGNISSSAGPGSFGNILINLVDPADQVDVNDDIDFSGTLYINQGELDVLVGVTMDFTADVVAHPLVKITTTAANLALLTATGTVTYSATTSLYYQGASAYAAGDEVDADPLELNNITVATTGGVAVTFGSATSADGILTINGDSEELDLGGNDLTLTGDILTHVVKGTLTTGAGELIVDGDACTITGSTDDGEDRTIEDLHLTLASDETFTMTNIENLVNLDIDKGTASVSLISDGAANTDGQFTGTLNLTAGTLTLAIDTDAGDDDPAIGGAVTIDDGTLILGNSITAESTFNLGDDATATGSVALNSNNLTLDGVFTHDGVGDVTGDGWLVVDYSVGVGNFVLTKPLSVSNLEIDAQNAVTQTTDDLTVTSALLFTSGTYSIGALDLTVTGNSVEYEAGTFNGTGNFILNGTTMQLDLNNDFAVAPDVELDAASLLVVDADDNGEYDFTIAGDFTQTIGDISLADNNLILNADFDRTAGAYAMEDGMFVFDGSGAITGQGVGFSVDNLKVMTAAVTMDDEPFRIEKLLVLAEDLDANSAVAATAQNLTFADLATIERQANKDLVEEAEYEGSINLAYTTAAAITTSEEADATSINDVTIAVGTTLTLDRDFGPINGTLSIAGVLADAGDDVDMAANSTLKLVDQIGTAALTGGPVVPAGALNVYYDNGSGGALATTDNELDADWNIMDVTVDGVSAADDITLHDDIAINGLLLINDDGDFDLDDLDLDIAGNLQFTSTGRVINGGAATSALTFSGAATKTLDLATEWIVGGGIDFHVAMAADDVALNLSGSDLDLNTNAVILKLDKGVFSTDDDVAVLLHHSSTVNVIDQGFVRTSPSVITGNAKKIVNRGDLPSLANIQFPVGSDPTATEAADYRPATFFFPNTPAANFELSVNHQNESPNGTNGILPGGLDGGDGVVITNYPDFYWYVASDLTLNPSLEFDIEFQAADYPFYETDLIQDVRIIRRDSGNVANQWRLQGTSDNYDNSTINQTWPVAKVIAAKGGVTTQGSRFSFSQSNLAPIIAKDVASPAAIDEGDTLIVNYTASDFDLGDVATLSVMSKPDGADYAATNVSAGTLTWVTTQADTGSVSIIMQAVDNYTIVTYDTLVVTVADITSAPVFTKTMGDTTARATHDFAFQYEGNDPDGNAVTYFLSAVTGNVTSDTATISVDGLLTWTSDVADVDSMAIYVVGIEDGSDTTYTTDSITVVGNTAPSFVAVGASILSDTLIYVGDTLNVTYTAIDADNDVLTYTFVGQYPADADLDPLSGVLSWAPQTAAAFPVTITVQANDGTDSTSTFAVVTIDATTVSLSGVVTYNGGDLLENVEVMLSDGQKDTTDASGAYTFTGLLLGDYTITAAKADQVGGALASDALETQLYVVNPDSTFLATDLQKLAADVVGVGNITSGDALAILNRSVGIDDFQIADWLFESKTVAIASTDKVQDLKGIAAGDARGDYTPALGLAKSSSIAVNSEEVLNIKKDSEFELPISMSELTEVGSYTMKLKYAADKVEFLGATTSNGGMLVSNVVDDVISIAWMSLNSKEVKVKEGGALATLKFRATELFSKSDEVSLELLAGAELTDRMAKNINAGISIPVVAIGIPDVFALRQNYPNPFNPSTTIQYDLPENGKVTLTIYNSLGQTVGTLVNQKQVAGAYDVKFNASNLASGVYLYRVTVEGTKNFVMTKKMILMK
jgi:Secretion system C-terminal sorting domain/Protein of unknown function (DUF1565)